MNINLNKREAFEHRHNSPSDSEIASMLEAIGAGSLDQLINETIPARIHRKGGMSLPAPKTEYDYINDLKKVAGQNVIATNFIGQGYHGTIVPPVIQRNILENPGWYTAYTPYQAEIAQGRLEALINFQTLVIELTGMEIANASLLDESTAAAEAISMFAGARKGAKKKANRLIVDERVFPQTLEVIQTRTVPQGIVLEVTDILKVDLTEEDIFAVFFQYPDNHGEVRDWSALTQTAKELGLFVGVACDLLSLTILTPPGSWGVDAVVGTTQRFGVPMGFGGPHAAYFATKESFKRLVPGRIIGVSKDADGHTAYRMALQTREQHIKREKATSNICTAQVLLAVMASMYAVYHGPAGLRHIALRIHGLAKAFAERLKALGLTQQNELFFDTLKVEVEDADALKQIAESRDINLRYFEDGTVGISFDQTHNTADLDALVDVFATATGKQAASVAEEITVDDSSLRSQDYLTHEVFNSYQSEHEMLRYIRKLENKDLSLVHSMISLGSCTMKLNATSEMIPVTWPEFGGIHPFAPASQTLGYQQMLSELHDWLAEITGFDAVSFQPNSGAQGEYTGLMVIRAYHLDRGDDNRNVAIIPTSAHGTNPASAVMAGMEVVLVACDDHGNVDMDDLQAKAEQYKDRLSALMVTYPSTHGVFEESIIEICELIHSYGGLVYMDGANMNAQVGLTSPALIGADVCHLNLHKTFCIPHGGGGPGMGPIGVVSRLTPYLPQQGEKGITAVSGAPYGSASILPISHAYIAMMGDQGLTNATKIAILNANYIAKRLEGHYPVLYKGKNGRSAHEMIIDCRGFKQYGVEVEDIAKRLMDYGYHAPTVSFPVAGTMMIEPTESETKSELDRFCDVMVAVRAEIEEVIVGSEDVQNNVLKNAPHTYRRVVSDNWEFPYSREKAAFPLPHLRENKFWPSVSRIDSAYGDRNLMCSCVPIEAYGEITDVS
ncbi:MAG: glycine dehydrogenase [Cyclobacteriaceae bacterium]|jgi:glycine dehydrogenase